MSAFACQHDRPSHIERPRQLNDGRITFLVLQSQPRVTGGIAEFVRMARPFLSREQLFPNTVARIRSVQPAGNGDVLVCAEGVLDTPQPFSSVFRRKLPELRGAKCKSRQELIESNSGNFGAPLFAATEWHSFEAAEVIPQRQPMGRLSNVDPGKNTGQILCLNANNTSTGRGEDKTAADATRVRVLAEGVAGEVRALGEVPLQPDGSFMAEVPADVALGFEALDAGGHVLRRVSPVVWVRPGENRSCIGCHEPHNRSPQNHRPLAVCVPVPSLNGTASRTASRVSGASIDQTVTLKAGP
jgi:hypothetical protein